MTENFEAQDERMAAYLNRAQEIQKCFKTFKIQHIPRDHNACVNALATKVSGSAEITKGHGKLIQSIGIVSEIREVNEAKPED